MGNGSGPAAGNGALETKGQPESSLKLISKIPPILPHERVFPIQIGSELFKLSGASISSDAPSYFSQYFSCQVKKGEEKGGGLANAIRTLYIDRDPITFRDIALHLQGYHVQPRDGTHFVRLFADAQFYSLPKLISQLYEESIFMTIGHQEFQIPRELFTDPGNSPNFFSLGFAIFFSKPDDLFPGLDREGLIRPPSILPPSVPGRSAETFSEILHMLRGYPVEIRNEAHRAALLRDCRYFNFKGLEQRLVPHTITFNQSRRRHEICLQLESILKSGISINHEPSAADPLAAWVNYARPYADEKPHELVVEIGGESTRLHLGAGGSGLHPRAEFFRDTRTRIARLLEVICNKLNLPPGTQRLGLLGAKGKPNSQPDTPGTSPAGEDLVGVVLGPEASITLDGRPWVSPSMSSLALLSPSEAGGHEPNLLSAEDNDNLLGGGGVYHDSLADHTFASPSDGGVNFDFPMSMSTPMAMPMSGETPGMSSRKRRRVDDGGDFASGSRDGGGGGGGEEWIVKTGQWRLKIQTAKSAQVAVECVLVAVRLEAFTSEMARNAQKGFLSG